MSYVTHHKLLDALPGVHYRGQRFFRHMDESWLAYYWVMSHMWMSHVTHQKMLDALPGVTFIPDDRISADSWMSHVSHIMKHVTYTNESCHTSEIVGRAASSDVHSVGQDVFRLVRVSHVSHVRVSHVSHVRVSHVSHVRVSHVLHVRVSHVSHVRVSHVSNVRVSHVLHVRVSLVSHVMHPVIYEWVMSHITNCWTRCLESILEDNVSSDIGMSHVSHVNESCHICEWVMSHVRKCWMRCLEWIVFQRTRSLGLFKGWFKVKSSSQVH